MDPDVQLSAPDSAPLRSLWSLEPDRVFLNHGSYGACPTAVRQYQAELQSLLERSPSDFMARQFPTLLDPAREELAVFLGSQPGHVAFLTNATAGVNSVLRSLPWQPGDEILMTDHGYNACCNVVSYLAQSAGVQPVVAKLPFPLVDEGMVLDAVLSAVTPRTKLAMLDHVTSPTALVLPVAELARGLAAKGVKVLIDGAHAPGMLDLNLESLGQQGVTYYTGNLHKWCCAPKGSAFLWTAADHQRDLHPHVISHGFNSLRSRPRFWEEFDWCGTFDPSSWLAAPLSLKMLGELYPGGWSELRDRCHQMLLHGRDIVSAALPKQNVVKPEMLGQIASLEIPKNDQEKLYRWLYDSRGIDSMITTWQGRTILRLSAAPYNTLCDYHALAAALTSLPSQYDG